jgi:DNA-binding transcriptional regulator YhcF (GntR family)
MTDGRYPLSSYLPSQRDLAEEFHVSRDTVQRVLRELVNEGWIESHQGRGSKVVNTQLIQSSAAKGSRLRRGATLEGFISEAFEQPTVTLDVYTLTSESLYGHIQRQVDRIRDGFITPQRIALRMLLPSETLSLPYPHVKEGEDDPRLRQRLRTITEGHTESLRGSLTALQADDHLVPYVDVQIRRAPLTPAFKLYLLNGDEALHGPYEVIERKIELVPGEEITVVDVLGFRATLTHHVKNSDPNSLGTVFVDSMQKWFDSVWTLLSE